MGYFIDAFSIPAEFYWTWMRKRKTRQKARFYKKLNRIKTRCANAKNKFYETERNKFYETERR